MPSAVDRDLLNWLDRLIIKYELPSGDPPEPVNLDGMLEAFFVGYDSMPREIEAVTARWKGPGRHFINMMYDLSLKEPSQSAQKRYAGAHEFGHILCRHKGDMFVLRRPGSRPGAFDRFLDKKQERESDYVAAYLLVPMKALEELAGQEPWYIARVLDVPEKLVGLRQEIWEKWKK